jgi:alanyl-tRNA synthetase
MATRRLFHEDAYQVRFRSRVVALREHERRAAVELEETCFYPEGGGQPSDRGTLDGVPIVDVQVTDDGRVLHFCDAPGGGWPGAGGAEPGAELEGEVDWARRFDAMQQHSGQHVLSAAFEHVADATTLSSTLGAPDPAGGPGPARNVIEVALQAADWRLVERVEAAANRAVWEDRPVAMHLVEPGDLERFRLRKRPAKEGPLRVVEVEGWDASACGGTHVRRTGEIGGIKVLRWERVRDNLRFEFLCGERAWRDHAWRTEALAEAARRHTLGEREVIARLERLAGERDELRKGLAALTQRLIAAEALERTGDPPVAVVLFDAERPRDEVRMLAIKVLEAGAPWVVLGAAGPEPVIVVGRAAGDGADARALLPGLMERAQGRGGGSPSLVQVGARDAACAETAWRWALESWRGAAEGA